MICFISTGLCTFSETKLLAYLLFQNSSYNFPARPEAWLSRPSSSLLWLKVIRSFSVIPGWWCCDYRFPFFDHQFFSWVLQWVKEGCPIESFSFYPCWQSYNLLPQQQSFWSIWQGSVTKTFLLKIIYRMAW